MVDMAPELLQQIQSDWSDNLKNDAEIKSLIEKINEGKATYKEVEDLSYRVGKDLSKSLLDNITEDILPNGHVPQNVAEKILHPTLNNAHNLVTNVAIKVQSDMNSAAEIGLRAQKTDYDKDRAQGLVHKLTNGQFEDTKWILDEPVTLFVQSVADNTLKKNVDFQAHSGLKPQIIRKASSKCCDWCEDLEGTYDYGSEPKDVYRRHERCKCSVDYNPGTGKRQDVWSKAWHEDADKDKINQRIESNLTQSGGKLTGGHRYSLDEYATKKDIKAAEKYEEYSRKDDSELIAKNTGFSKKDIQTIRSHVFFRKHQLKDGYGRFDPDYDMAVAWSRLQKGNFLSRDITLLNHELLESQIEKKYNISAEEAHIIASKTYDWAKQLYDEMGEKGEPYGLL